MIALTVALAVVVGVSLGLLGGGGSILTVPLLTYVAGMDAKEAIATSLLVVGVTSAVAAITHAKAGRIRWRVGFLFGLAGMAGAYAGGLLSRFIAGSVLLLAFAAMMIATAVAMLRGRKNVTAPDDTVPSMPVGRILLDGTIVGLVTGLVGAGGGFLVVPALALLGGLSMPVAVATSLIVIAMKSFAGFGGYLSAVQVNWPLAAMVTAAAVVGSLIGGRLTSSVDPDTLRQGFGWFVLLMSSVILAQELHPVAGVALAALTLTAAGTDYACARSARCPLKRWRNTPAATA